MNESTPEISVLMPIYNSEQYLRQAFESLKNQTFKSFEVLCINDGSTDGSREIIQEYIDRDSRFRVIDKPNSGYGASMNRGIKESNGDYIAILEPDDFFIPTALETLISPINSESDEIDLVKANYWFYWSVPKESKTIISVVPKVFSNKLINPQENPELYLSIPSVWSAIYRKKFLIDNNIRFLETPGASFQDLSFTFKTWAFSRNVFLLGQPILNYRQDNESSSVNNPSKATCVFREIDEIDRTLKDLSNKEKIGRYVYRIKYDNYMWNFQRLSKDLRETFFKRMYFDLLRGNHDGKYDPALFYSWQNKNLDLILNEPQSFLDRFPDKPDRLSKAWYYLKLGGPRVLIDALKRV